MSTDSHSAVLVRDADLAAVFSVIGEESNRTIDELERYELGLDELGGLE
ncbi:hypothetical protein NDO75_23405 [Natrinema sp. 1APR25-10V2]|nr:hypothetical protein [Natrinema sp. 1APR25-10V2]